MRTGLRRLLRLLWSCFAWVTIGAAVLLTTARLLLPLAGHYRADIVRAVEQSVGRPVRVEALKPEWRGFGPVILLRGVQLLSRPGGKPLLSFNQARIGIDLLSSLFHGRLEGSHLTVTGVDITLLRRDNGRLGVEGFGSVATGGAEGWRDLQQIQAWLQAQRRITIADSDIYWHDARRGASQLHFSHVTLALENHGQRHRVSGSAVLPATMGRTLTLALSFRGPLLEPGRWTGDLYVKGASLQLPGPLGRHAYAGIAVGDGVADLRAWGRIQSGAVRDLEGGLQVDALQLAAVGPRGAHRPEPLRLKALGARFHWRRHARGWVVDADRVWFAKGDEVTPRTRVRVFTRHGAGGSEVDVQAGYVPLDAAVALVGLSDAGSPALHRMLATLGPTGTLRHADLHLDAPRDKPLRPYLYARFAGLGTAAPWHGIPAVNGLKGVFRGSPAAGTVTLDSRSVAVAKGGGIRRALSIDRLGGRIAWSRRADRWRVSSAKLHMQNPDMAVNTRFVVKGGRGRPRPFVDLVADVHNVDIGHLPRYLPAAKMRPHNVRWLDRALVHGNIASGGVVLHGNLADFPFDHHEGTFQVRLNVDDGILDFNPKWPRIEEIQAEVMFDGRALSLDNGQGKMLNSAITHAKVHIPDLTAHPALLTFTGDAAGPTRDALYIATHTPVKKKVGRYLKGAKVGGHATLSLSLRIPLSRPPEAVQGRLTLRDSTLALANKIRLTNINGPLTFTRKGLSSGGIKARLVGYPATITAGTQEARDHRVIYFAARGRTDVRHIRQLQFLDLPFLQHVSGRTPWRARLQLTEMLRDKRTYASLKIHSGLEGMRVDLPAPLAKAPRDRVPLTVTMSRLGRPSTPVTFRYGGRLSGAFVTESAGIGRGIRRGAFRFGGGAATLPSGKGIYVSGKLNRFFLAEWRHYFPPRDGTGQAGVLGRVVRVDVRIGELHAFGWGLHRVSLQARKGAERWSAKVDSEELAGSVESPLVAGRPVVADLDYVRLKPAALHDKGRRLDPNTVPPARITSKEVTYDGKAFGSLRLILTRRPQGLHIKELSIDSDVVDISASGDWTKGARGQYSAFEATITTQDVGKTLSRFGYVGTIKGGRGDVQLTAAWSGAPTNMDVKSLVGSLSLKLSKGRLLDVDPGAGRILGILSLQALPRRLTLDFSDLFEKGFSFDSMKGDFSIRNGNAYTDNLVMEGPSARVNVNGRVGLVSHDYDQTVTVTPHLSSGLPIAGVIASGVGVGVAILLLQKIFEDQIDEMTRVRYTIKGPWKKPKVQPLRKEAASAKGGKS